MKAHRLFVAACVLAGTTLVATKAGAECRREGGYVFVSAFCSTQAVRDPSNVCEHRRGDHASVVGFFSNVLHDSARNRTYPSSVFYDEIENQYDVSKNGHTSACYASRAEAENARRHDIADAKRQGIRIRTVSMPDT